MSKLLYFNGQPIGTHLVLHRPASSLLTPPAVSGGFLRSVAKVDTASRNLLRAWEFVIAVIRDDEDAMAHAAEAIMQLQGTRGTAEVRIGFTVKAKFTDWAVAGVPPPPMALAYGGRLVTEWPITLIGETPPVLSAS